jgi:hypothetical protein
LAALDAVRALDRALHRVAGVEAAHVKQPEKFREIWRPERLKALALFPQVLARHQHPMIRFAARQLLQRDLAYEEDAEFADAVRKVVATIPDDLELRLTTVVNTQGYFEFIEQIGPPKGEGAHEKIRQFWEERVRSVAEQFLREAQKPEDAVAQLEEITKDSLAGGYSPIPPPQTTSWR